MSDTTPRPDETPTDATPPTPPPYPAPEPAEYPVPLAPQAYDPGTQQQFGEQPPPSYGPPAGQALVPNPMTPSDERTTGMIAHAGTLAATVLSGGTLGFVCALVIYLLFRDRGPFVRHHSANALNVQIFGAILVIGGILLTITVIGAIIGIPMIIAAGVYVLVVHIIGAVKANNGEWWTPPMTPQFVK